MPTSRAQPDDATLTQVLSGLKDEGYDGDVIIDEDGGLRCTSCGQTTPAAEAQLDGLRRVEGVSDPADMAAVLATTCPGCGAHGTAVVRYGPEAGPGDSAVLLAIEDHRPAGIDVAEGASRHEPAAAPTGGTGAVDPHEPVGSFGGDGHSDQGGDSDVGLSSGE